MLALTFSDETDYDKIQEDDRVDFTDLTSFAPGKPLTLVFKHKAAVVTRSFATTPTMRSRSNGSKRAAR